jgi:cysteine desulfurase
MPTMRRIYLDYNASTPIDPAVAAAMRPFLEDQYGNPSSGHWAAGGAKAALETARGQVATLLKGVFLAHRDKGDHIITTRIEHPAIIEPCRFLERLGGRVTYLPVDGTGRVDTDDLRKAITPRTILVSVMHANNEVGTIQPVADCARISHENGVPFHTDAAQSVGKVPTDVNQLGVDLLSIAGHKVYAPKGVGALFVRRNVSLEPLIHGAGHELGRRAGTESALLAVGLGKACELARDLRPMDRLRGLRDHFWQELQKRFGNRVVLNGHPAYRLPNTLNASFVNRISAEILGRLDGVAASTGSACHSGRIELSPVLEAMVVHELEMARRVARPATRRPQNAEWPPSPDNLSTAVISPASLQSFPDHQSGSRAGRPIGVGVLKFIPSDAENTLLICSHPVWERTALDVNDKQMIYRAHRIGAEVGDASLDDCFVFFLGPGHTIVGRDLGKVRTVDHYRKATIAIKHQGAFWTGTERLHNLSPLIDLSRNQRPRTNKLFARLSVRIAGRRCKCERQH